jgi:uncharacterized OsmC-like protein
MRSIDVSSRRVSSTWRPGPLKCEVTAGAFSIAVDEAESSGGTGTAPEPTDLLLASAASCFTLAFAHSAAKRSIPLNSLRVDVDGFYAGLRFASLRISVDADGPSPEQIVQLLDAAQRVCYVTKTLRASVTVEVSASTSPSDGAGEESGSPRDRTR